MVHVRVDMSLPVGGELPAANSRQAADVARRVLRWASDTSTPEPAYAASVVADSDPAHF